MFQDFAGWRYQLLPIQKVRFVDVAIPRMCILKNYKISITAVGYGFVWYNHLSHPTLPPPKEKKKKKYAKKFL